MRTIDAPRSWNELFKRDLTSMTPFRQLHEFITACDSALTVAIALKHFLFHFRTCKTAVLPPCSRHRRINCHFEQRKVSTAFPAHVRVRCYARTMRVPSFSHTIQFPSASNAMSILYMFIFASVYGVGCSCLAERDFNKCCTELNSNGSQVEFSQTSSTIRDSNPAQCSAHARDTLLFCWHSEFSIWIIATLVRVPPDLGSSHFPYVRDACAAN